MGVDIFFVLSGFVIALSSQRYIGKGISFGLHRFIRVLPNYWFYTILLFGSLLILPDATYLTQWNPSSLAQSFALIPNANPSGHGLFPTLYVGWTLTFEMFFYLVTAFILIFNNSKPVGWTSISLGVLLLLFNDSLFLGNDLMMLIEFISGMLLFKVHTYPPSNYKKNACILLLLASTIITTYVLIGLNGIFIRCLIGVFILYTFLSMNFIFEKPTKLNTFLIKLGSLSYSTYLSHTIVIGWFYFVFRGGSHTYNDTIAIIGVVIVTYLLSSFSYSYVETGSLTKYLKVKINNYFK